MAKLKLFDEGDVSGDNLDKLNINKCYADNYERWRQKEEYQKLKDKYGEEYLNSEESDSSSEDGLAEADNAEFDMDFFRCLAALRLRHPVLNKEKKFFKDSYTPNFENEHRKDDEALNIREFQTKQLLQSTGNDDSSIEVQKPGGIINKPSKFILDDDVSDDEEGELFTKPIKCDSPSDVKQENEALNILKGKKKSSQMDNLDVELLEGLKNNWQKEMTTDEKFLMDYFVNQRYLDEEDTTVERAPNHVAFDFEPLEEDEKTLEKMEEYETKYRFRFEEPDEDFIRRYPRVAEDSIRKKDNSRFDARQRKKLSVKLRNEQKYQEIKRLKALQKKEIMDKIKQLEEVAGRNDIGFKAMDLESDFDPSHHDSVMSEIFNDNYYEEGNERDRPSIDEDLNREIEEEYAKLEGLDDMTEGNFKYMEVFSNDYGLTTEEIFCAKDSELNRWISMKRVLRCGKSDATEMRDAKSYAHRATLKDVKCKILPSLFSESIEEQWRLEEERKRLKNRKKKERRLRKKEREEHKFEEGIVIGDCASSDENGKQQLGVSEPKENKLISENEAITCKSKTSEDSIKKKRKSKSIDDIKIESKENQSSSHLSCSSERRVQTSSSNKNKFSKSREKGSLKSQKKIINDGKIGKSKTKLKGQKLTVKKKISSAAKEAVQNQFRGDSELEGISDSRLKAYGVNPKKIRRSIKYKAKIMN